MIETFLGFLLVLTVLAASATLARKIQLAPAIVFLLVGIVLAFTPGFLRIEMKPEGVLLLVLPPLIWGWLTYRVMAYDALADHASAEERRTVLKQHRVRLLGMGVFAGYLGAAPSLVWVSGALVATFFVILRAALSRHEGPMQLAGTASL